MILDQESFQPAHPLWGVPAVFMPSNRLQALQRRQGSTQVEGETAEEASAKNTI